MTVQCGLQLSGVASLTAKCRKLVGHFRHSAQATAKLKHMQKTLKMKEVKVKQEVASRWNSMYDMMERIIQLKAPIATVLMEGKASAMSLVLSGEEFRELTAIMEVLKPLAEATTRLCKEKFSCLFVVEPLLSALLEKHLIVEDGTDDLSSVLRRTIANNLKERIRKQHCRLR